MSFICTKCKIKNPAGCSKQDCPIFSKGKGMVKNVSLLSKQDFFGKSPNVFVGRFGYPDVNVGFLSTEKYEEHDNPLLWSRDNYKMDKIIDLRTGLVNSNFKSNIRSFEDRLVEMGKEVGMAENPVDMEINLTKKPEPAINYQNEAMPHGPNVKLKNARITENAKIPRAVDKAVSDTDLKAGAALNDLYKKRIDEHYLTRLLSIGTLGVKQQRKMVPTRFSITAVDSNLGNNLAAEVKNYPQSGHLAFFGGYLGNYFIILLFPEIYSYELFETSVSSSRQGLASMYASTTDYEPYEGRTTYASETAGGFYACRLALLEKLTSIRRQASCLCLRFITDEYYAPLGVFVVREAVRKTLANKPLEFDSRDLMLTYTRALIKKKFNYDIAVNIVPNSNILKNIKSQKKLGSFF